MELINILEQNQEDGLVDFEHNSLTKDVEVFIINPWNGNKIGCTIVRVYKRKMLPYKIALEIHSEIVYKNCNNEIEVLNFLHNLKLLFVS